MQDPSWLSEIDWSQVVSLVIGFGGLGLSFWTQWLAHKERSQPYRQRLYDRQLDSYVFLADTVGKIAVTARNALLKRPSSALSTEERVRLRSILDPLMDKHVEGMHLHTPFIPSPLADAIHSVMEAVACFSSHPQGEESFPKELWTTNSPRQELERRYRRFTQTLRKYVGVDALTEQSLRILELK